MPDDLRDVRDDLERDMALHEINHGDGEVHAARNQAIAAQALEQFERERAALTTVKPDVHGSTPIERSVESRDVDGKKYTVTREADTAPMFRSASEFEAQVIKRAQPRIDLLMSKLDSGPLGTPSWRNKTLAAMYFKVKSLEAKAAGQVDLETYYERAFQLDLAELLEASNQIFGDWRKLDEPRVQV